MTTLRTIVLGTVLILGLPSQGMAADGWGPSWSFNAIKPTTSNHLTYLRTILVPGRLPSLGSAGPLSLWPGISNPTSDLIQTTANAYANNGNSSYCGATATQWCVEASVFGSFGQRNGTAVAVDPDDHITIEYKLESDNNTWTQTVSSKKLNKVISTLKSTSGLLLGGGMGFATEAQNESFTIDNQYYLCTEARLATADATWGATASGGIGANHGATGQASGPGSAKNIHTPDSGKTWLIDLITLPAMNPQGSQTPAPAYDCSSASAAPGDAGVWADAGSPDGRAGGGRTGQADAGAVDARSSGGATGSGGTLVGGHSSTADAGMSSTTGGSHEALGSGGIGGTSRSTTRLGEGGSSASSGAGVGSSGGVAVSSGGQTGGSSVVPISSAAGGRDAAGGSSGSTHGSVSAVTTASTAATSESSGCSCTIQKARHSDWGAALIVLGCTAIWGGRGRRKSMRSQVGRASTSPP